LNDITEVTVTESYLGLKQNTIRCQDKEPYYNCTTRCYIDTILKQCGCLPLNLNMGISPKVLFISLPHFQIKSYFILVLQEPLCSSEAIECVSMINVNSSHCQKPCSGLIVTSFSFEKNNEIDDLLSFLKPYNHYKKITQQPTGYKGKI